ncbi:hypothetical protein NBG4_1070004 [Candidatus Sulfobium mesophilum]|uniref:Uncharacterized protein n=1 Tax=Candidatus Sulfobium mesophilum TaxID=2016548 RepID=A0A2U3QEB2_9BACT|nr:hypothetical protein NBG4_1070004 [Candidatus Sulfobium mesophilum]
MANTFPEVSEAISMCPMYFSPAGFDLKVMSLNTQSLTIFIVLRFHPSSLF